MTKDYEVGSGNVFADIGLPKPEQKLVKAALTLQIYRVLKRRRFTQIESMDLLGASRLQVCALMRMQPASVSVGRLMEFLTILGQDVEVRVKPARRRRAGHMSVLVKAAQ